MEKAEQVEIIVGYWTNCLTPNAPQTSPVIGGTIDSITELMLSNAQAEEIDRVTPEQVAAFRDALRAILTTDNYMTLTVDYHPCPLLEAACKAAGIDGEWLFPVKTSTWVESGIPVVSEGYGAKSHPITAK